VRKGVPALYVKAGIDFVGKPAGFGEELAPALHGRALPQARRTSSTRAGSSPARSTTLQALHAVVRRVLDGEGVARLERRLRVPQAAAGRRSRRAEK
jgi:hypothetical protein